MKTRNILLSITFGAAIMCCAGPVWGVLGAYLLLTGVWGIFNNIQRMEQHSEKSRYQQLCRMHSQ